MIFFNLFPGSKLKQAPSCSKVAYQKLLASKRPSLWSSIQKGVTGAVVLGLHYLLDAFSGYLTSQGRDTASHLARTTGFALILDSAFEITTEGLLYISKQRAPQNNFASYDRTVVVRGSKKHKRKVAQANYALVAAKSENANDPERETKEEMVRYLTILRYQNIGRAGINAIATLFVTLRYLINLRYFPEGTSLFSLWWPEGTALYDVGPILKYINMPIIYPISILFLSIATLYNFCELSFSLAGPYPRRGESPIFGFINSYAYIGATAQITRSLVQTSVLTSIPLGSSTEQISQISAKGFEIILGEGQMRLPLILLLTTLNAGSSYYIYRNFLQVCNNGRHLFFQETNNPTIEVESEFIRPHNTKRHNTFFSADQALASSTTALPGNFLSDDKEMVERHKSTSVTIEIGEEELPEEEAEQAKEPKIKVKRKSFVPNLQTNLGIDVQKLRLEGQDSEEIYLYAIKDREEKLAEIRSLRDYNQINEREVLNELKALAKVLPKGQIIGIDGSESRLEWYWQKKRFSIKFEAPHGIDANQFRGRKLAKAINVLEVGYLWGWEKQKREAYLSEHRHNGNLERLAYIFGERPKF